MWENKISEFIFNWSKSNEEILNITSVPCNSSVYLLRTIMSYIYNQKKVIYITGEDENEIDLINYIKQYTDYRGYTYIRYKNINTESSLVVCNYENAASHREKYDLVIYNDIRSIPIYSKYEIIDLAKSKCKDTGKIIFYSIEGILNNKREVMLPINTSKLPQIEPRVVLTRLDMNKEIPYVIYDYLNWSLKSKRKVIIYVPTSQQIANVYKHITKCGSNLTKNIYYYEEGANHKVILKFKNIKEGILITDCFLSTFNTMKNLDRMIFFANDEAYNYKKLVYLCGSSFYKQENFRGEVIFLANVETEDMETARKIMRDFNKEAWEKKLLKI